MNFLQKVIKKRGIARIDIYTQIKTSIFTEYAPEKLIDAFSKVPPHENKIEIPCIIKGIPQEIYKKEYLETYGKTYMDTIEIVLTELQFECDQLINVDCEVHFTRKADLATYTKFTLLPDKSHYRSPICKLPLG